MRYLYSIILEIGAVKPGPIDFARFVQQADVIVFNTASEKHQSTHAPMQLDTRRIISVEPSVDDGRSIQPPVYFPTVIVMGKVRIHDPVVPGSDRP